jgi:nucleoside-diphosphate-sugar epimerase
MTTQVLVTGATGFVGSHVVEALLARGYAVRALVRHRVDAPWLLGAEQVEGDVVNRESIRSAVQGCEAVVHCALTGAHARL